MRTLKKVFRINTFVSSSMFLRWLPLEANIKTLLWDVNYCERLQRQMNNLIKVKEKVSPKAYKEAPPRVKMMYIQIFWDKFEMRDKKIQKAIPSKAVSAMIKDKLISLKAKHTEKRVSIKNVWLLELDSNQ